MKLKIGKTVKVVKKHTGDGALPIGCESMITDIKRYRGVLAGMKRIQLSDGKWYDDRSIG